jgi:hypothetical protein
MANEVKETAKWFHYLLAFMAGIFLMNALPHLVMGVTGQLFPTPFANPPGEGLSSPVYNVLWATINFSVGIIFIYFSKVKHYRNTRITLGLGGIVMAFYLANYFGQIMQ